MFSFRVDIDMKKGLIEGVPNLLKLLKKYDIKASFYIPMGGESSIFEALKYRGPGGRFKYRWGLPKMSIFEMARRLLLPLNFTENYVHILKQAIEEGHHIGVHGYKHRIWTRALERIDVEEQLRLASDMYLKLFGKRPISFAAPGFRTNTAYLLGLDALGFRVASDLPGSIKFHPKIKGKVCKHIQVPITIRRGSYPIIEYYDMQNKSDEEIIKLICTEIMKKKLATMYIHAEYEGVKRLHVLEEIFKFIRKNKIKTKTIEELV